MKVIHGISSLAACPNSVAATVSDPTHQRYGNHLTADEVNELVKPTGISLGLVIDWLAEHGIERHRLNFSPAKD